MDSPLHIRRVGILSLHSSPLAPLGSTDAGGMNLYVRRLAEQLQMLDIQADVFTRRTDPRVPEIAYSDAGSRVIHLPAGPARPLPKSLLPLRIPALVRAFQAFTEREGIEYDVLHSHYWLSGLAALRCREDSGTPVVHMFHTLAKVKEDYFGWSDPADSALRDDGERCLIHAADAVVGATESERCEMERLYGRSPREFRAIPPGVDVEIFRPQDKQKSRDALGIDAERVILFVGRLERIKNLHVLLKAVADLSRDLPCRLVVVGGSSNQKAGAELKSVARRLGIAQAVDFRGVVGQSELPRYYSAADICAIPSAYESFGMAALESMACQTPVVAFAVGGLATTIKDGKTGFLAEPGSTIDFADKLRHALQSAELDSIGRQARLSVQRFTWPTVAQRTLDLYQRVKADQLYVQQCTSAGSQTAG
jgi:D-inositol-3-phosphate glycosyltransferase